MEQRKREMKMSRFFQKQAMGLVVFLLSGTLAAPVHGATLEKINASYGAISGSMAPIWVAKEARLFEKHGLDLNLLYISGGPRSIMSLLGGSIQFVNHSGMPALEAYQRGRRHGADRLTAQPVGTCIGGAEKASPARSSSAARSWA